MRYVTREEIEYRLPLTGGFETVTIPAGTFCILADNLPNGDTPQYWACEWEGMTDVEASRCRNYGFLLDASDVREVEQLLARAEYLGNPGRSFADLCGDIEAAS